MPSLSQSQQRESAAEFIEKMKIRMKAENSRSKPLTIFHLSFSLARTAFARS